MFDLFSDAAKVAQQMEIISSEYGFALWETLYSLALEVLFAYVVGLPLGVLLVSPKKVNLMDVGMTTVSNLKELVGIMVMVGVLNQILTLTGARGLLSLGVVILPIWLLSLIDLRFTWFAFPISEVLVGVTGIVLYYKEIKRDFDKGAA